MEYLLTYFQAQPNGKASQSGYIIWVNKHSRWFLEPGTFENSESLTCILWELQGHWEFQLGHKLGVQLEPECVSQNSGWIKDEAFRRWFNHEDRPCTDRIGNTYIRGLRMSLFSLVTWEHISFWLCPSLPCENEGTRAPSWREGESRSSSDSETTGT